MGLAQEEVAALQNWIRQGHVLIVVPGSKWDDSTLRHRGMNDAFLDDWFTWKSAADPFAKETDEDLPAPRPWRHCKKWNRAMR